MKDLKFWEVQALVDFMYRGEVNVGQDKLPSLLAAAEALQIKGEADTPLDTEFFIMIVVNCAKVDIQMHDFWLPLQCKINLCSWVSVEW